jgi:SAM-dependent methyltransferase
MNTMSQPVSQLEYWNGAPGQKWVRNQAIMDASLADATAGLFACAAIAPGEKVLDIGCGSGETSLMAAAAVGPQGTVTGLDISKPLLELARRRAEGVANLRFIEADASAHPFTPAFDLLLSRFGVMFFDEPRAAFANIRKAAAPGGRIAFVCWRALSENEYAAMPFEIAKPLMPPLPPPNPHAPGPFALSDPDRLCGILAEAGFRDIALGKLDGAMRMGTTAEEAGIQATSLGPTARSLALFDDAVRARVLAAVTDAFRAYPVTDGHITCRIACWLVTAKCN